MTLLVCGFNAEELRNIALKDDRFMYYEGNYLSKYTYNKKRTHCLDIDLLKDKIILSMSTVKDTTYLDTAKVLYKKVIVVNSETVKSKSKHISSDMEIIRYSSTEDLMQKLLYIYEHN